MEEVQKNRRERRKQDQQLAKDVKEKTADQLQKELTKKFGTRAKAATRKPNNDAQAMQHLQQSGWDFIPQPTTEQVEEVRRKIARHAVNPPPSGWLLQPRQSGSGKPKTKEVLNIPPPILEYFDVKNDPHFIRAPKHQPKK